MLKLRPRKRIDPNKIPKRSKPEKACCGFCKTRIPRPKENLLAISVLVGTCPSCAAWYIDDSNGKLGGEAFVVGLTLLADGDPSRAMTLREGTDYEQCALVYDGRRHEVDIEGDPRPYGVGRMWFFRKLEPGP